MTVTDGKSRTADDPIEELREWLEANWSPDLTVGEWWELLGLAGWSAPMLPPDSYGRGLNRDDAMRVQRTIASFGALGAPAGLGLASAAPTIATHGTHEQVTGYVRDIVTGQKAWCQLFSEPGAGSDLAGLTTRAVRDGDEWIVKGQKVWTSGGQYADLGMLIARTDPEAPKHKGITWFALDMRQHGVEVRPLREMTGNAMFNEVFFNDAVVPDRARVGRVNEGWTVANTTLLHERSGMGSGGLVARGAPIVLAGTREGQLGRRVGDVVAGPAATRSPAPGRGQYAVAEHSVELARTFGKELDPVLRQELVRLYILRGLTRLNTERHKAVRAAGGDIPGIANFSKLMMADIVRLSRDLDLRILGARGTLHAYSAEDSKALDLQRGGSIATAAVSRALAAQAFPIFGGTDQIQRNIIAERVLGLPKEPGDLSHLPFNQLPHNG